MSLPKFAVRRRGFTLIELLIVIVVIAILALIVIPKLMGASRRAKDSTIKANLHILRNGIEQFQADTGMYPATMADLYAADGASAQGYDAVAGSDVTVPTGTYKGPYVKAASGAVNGDTCPLPANPYVVSTSGDDHWDYTKESGKVLPKMPTGIANDADGAPYSNY